MENRIFNHLPLEIIDEILHKLPVKSVLRFKCVSKSWRSSVSSGTTSTNSMRLQISPIITLIFRFDGVSPGSDSLQKRVGSCCIGSDPLRSNQSIPVPALEDNGTWKRGWHSLGCGLSRPMTTRLSAALHDHTRDRCFWKKIQNFGKGSLFNHPAKCVNGRLHWLTNKDKDDAMTSCYIVSLDLVEETYQIMAPPHCFSGYDYNIWPVLEDLGGYLSLICHNYTSFAVDFWVMKKESWSKIWTFPGEIGRFPKPVWLRKNGDLVVILGSDLIIYRGKTKLRQSPIDMFRLEKESIVYVESFVSPFDDDEELSYWSSSFFFSFS